MGTFTAGTMLLAVAAFAAAVVLAVALGRLRGLEKGARLQRDSEQRLRDVLESVGEGIITLGASGTIESFNRAAERMFGYAAAEAVGKDVRILMPEGEDDDRAGVVEQCLVEWEPRSVRGTSELRGRRKDGSMFPLEMSVREMRGAGGVRFVAVLRDNSERARMQAALVESEQRFRDLAEASSDWFWETGPDLRFVFVSARVRQVLGVNTAFFIGKTFHDFASASDETAHWNGLLDEMEARRPFRDFVFRQDFPDGRVKYLKISGRPIIDRNGVYCGYRGVGTDISREMEARAKARRAEQHLVAALESISEGFALWDAKDRLILFNSKFREIFAGAPVRTGMGFEDLARALARNGAAPDARERPDRWVDEQIARHRLAAGATVEVPLHDRWFLVSERRTPEGHVVAVHTEVTALKRREAEIAQRTAMAQAIIDNMPQGISVFDARGRLAALNDTARALLRVPPEAQRPGTALLEFVRLLAAQGEFGPDADAATLAEEIAAGCPAHRERERADGTAIELRCNTMPDGGFLVSYADITERKRGEAALRAAKEAAERGNRAKAAFLASVSHELRTPLNAIIGFSEAILGELFGPLGHPRYRDYMQDIYDSGSHLLNLINDILDISKAGAGKIDLDEVEIDLSTVVVQTVRLLSKRAESAKVDVITELPAGLPRLRGDMRRLRQILLNLLSNALKFTDEGGRITARARTDADGTLRLVIEDTGIGMMPQELDKAMEPFVQVDSRLSRRYEGTGLGLPLTKTLVEAHGGRFLLESEPGKGTKATVLFPAERVIGGADAASSA